MSYPDIPEVTTLRHAEDRQRRIVPLEDGRGVVHAHPALDHRRVDAPDEQPGVGIRLLDVGVEPDINRVLLLTATIRECLRVRERRRRVVGFRDIGAAPAGHGVGHREIQTQAGGGSRKDPVVAV